MRPAPPPGLTTREFTVYMSGQQQRSSAGKGFRGMVVKSERFEMRLDQQMIDRLDTWRESQEDHPSRAEAVRRLLAISLEGGRGGLVIEDGEKLILSMLADVYRATVKDGEYDPKFIKSAIYGGHHWAFEWMLAGLFHGHVDSKEVLSEVVNILDMWSYVETSFAKLSEISKAKVGKAVGSDRILFQFVGFDGNNESEHYSIARFMIEDIGRFQSFKDRSMNSHHQTLDRYRRQYRVFEPIRARSLGEPLRAADLIEILGAM